MLQRQQQQGQPWAGQPHPPAKRVYAASACDLSQLATGVTGAW